ncbi:MAG: class I SAM-dependent methyltransferase [Planctomycetes bacterium]|nr:class I SAM-dependent methyltransferase [Planctomycetota bacterium]
MRDSLFLMETMGRYNHWLYSNISRYVGERVLEVGSGTGNITYFMRDKRQVVSLEPDEASVREARHRFAGFTNIEIINMTLKGYSLNQHNFDAFDTTVCINVLEHIEDDVEALVCLRKHLAPGGMVVIIVPALPVLFGSLDRAFGHYRRYQRRSLHLQFQEIGLTVVKSFYMNLTGALGWFLHSRILHHQQLNSKTARRFDKLAPYLKKTESILKPPIGQSLIMVGKRNK